MIVIVGPTAIGKTELSLVIAEKYGAEIVSVDSMQVYRYMDIGTAKPSAEEQARAPHHVIDVADPDEDYSVARFVDDATHAIDSIYRRDKVPLLAGGTGLYLRGLLEGIFELPEIDRTIRDTLEKRLQEEGRESLYSDLIACDPDSAARIHPNDTHRMLRALEIYQTTGAGWSDLLAAQKRDKNFSKVLKIGLTCERDLLYNRINKRTGIMMEMGFAEEVQRLLDMGYNGDLNSMQSIGYRHMQNFLAGEWDRKETIELLARDTRRFAKRQYTWFNRDPDIRWFDREAHDEISSLIDNFLHP